MMAKKKPHEALDQQILTESALCTGPICWILKNIRPIKPIPCLGKQGLWNFEFPLR